MSELEDAHQVTNPEQTVVSAFAALHVAVPDRKLFIFVDDHGQDVAELTVHQLARSAAQVGALLAERGVDAGDRALLVYLPSLEFISAFLGCLAAGVIPVPVAPPNPFKLAHDVGGLAAIAASSGARVVLTHNPYQQAVAAAMRAKPLPVDGPQWPSIPWHCTDRHIAPEDDARPPSDWHAPADLDEPAFLQFTSGSTGLPKGVVVSHRNIHHELDAIAQDLALGADTVAVTWVPHFHDLGLISFLLNTIVGHSGRTYVMSPLSFLQRPSVWFDVMSRVRATHTSAPNFAYNLMVRKTTAEQRAGWDLSSLRILGSSGELVQPATVDRFFEAFTVAGLTPEVFCPGYGMAEHTLSVSMGSGGLLELDRAELQKGLAVPADPASADKATFYGCGWVSKADASLRIVDPETCRPCVAGQVGEIWVDSVTKARGYWQLDKETLDTFHAMVDDDTDNRRYLRTGDLGFLHGGELFVTGRLKELIIIRGHNYYPQDIEDSVRGCHPRIRAGGLAAFSAPTSTGERLVVLAESTGDAPDDETVREIIRAIRLRIRDDHGIACDEVVVGAQGLVLKTTSGKVRRNACREQFVQRESQRVAVDQSLVNVTP